MRTSPHLIGNKPLRLRVQPIFGLLWILLILFVCKSYAGTNDGLVGYWPANGTTVDTISGQAGTLRGSAGFASGQSGQAFSFGTASDAVAMFTNTCAEPYSAITVAAWVYPTQHGSDGIGDGLAIISRTDGDGFALRVFDGYLQPDLRLTGGNTYPVATTGFLPTNVWSHIAYTYDGSQIRLYVNGSLLQAFSATGSVKTNSNRYTVLMIGNEPIDAQIQPGMAFVGKIDEARVYNRALSVNEIRQLAGQPQLPPLDADSNLVAWYPFDGNATDATGNNLNGSLNGTQWTTDRLGNANAAILLNGSSAFVTVSDPLGKLNFDARSDNYSVSAWVKLNAIGTHDQQLLLDRNSGQPYSYFLLYSSSLNCFVWQSWDGNGGSGVVGVKGLTQAVTGAWYHVVMVMSNRQERLFVNGVDQTQPTVNGGLVPPGYSSTKNSDTIRNIGRYSDGNPSDYLYLNGALDDVRIYSRALSAAEVQQLYSPQGALHVERTDNNGIPQRDWGDSASATVHVYDAAHQSVSGAAITGTNAFTGAVLTGVPATDANGQTTITLTVPNNTPNGYYTNTLIATRAGYANSTALNFVVQVNNNTFSNFGVTVITHGYAPFDLDAESWMSEIGCAILRKAKHGKLWRFQAKTDQLTDVTSCYLSLLNGVTHDTNGEQVIMVRWEKTAGNTFVNPAGEAEAVGHQIYSLLMGGDANGVHGSFVYVSGVRKPLHMIGHSFGTAVISEAVQRLGYLSGVTVDQMTTLDPHDWDENWEDLAVWAAAQCSDCYLRQAANPNQNLGCPSLKAQATALAFAAPSGHVDDRALVPDVHIWSNVTYADNYYETNGGLTPHGRDVSGALNRSLNSLNGFGNADWTEIANPHSRVYLFYLGTIDTNLVGTTIDGLLIDPSWYQSGFGDVGYLYSRVGGTNHLDRFASINAARAGGDTLFYPPQNSTRTNWNGKADFTKDPPRPIFNGDFNTNFFDGVAYSPIDGEVPGYSTPIEAPKELFTTGQFLAQLYADPSGSGRKSLQTHLTYVPANAQTLSFELRGRNSSGQNDNLVVEINNSVLGTISANDFPAISTNISLSLTTNVDVSGIIKFTLNGYSSEADIGNIGLEDNNTPILAVAGSSGVIHNGQSAALWLGGIQGQFGWTQTITLKNIGGGTLTLANFHTSSGFNIVGSPSTLLAAGASTTFDLQVDTSTSGPKSGTVTFDSNDSWQGHFVFPVNAFVSAAGSLANITVRADDVTIVPGQNSAGINVGNSYVGGLGARRTFTIQNNGDQTLNIGTITPPSGFTIVSAPPSTLAGGQAATFEIQMTAAAVGVASGNLTIASDDPSQSEFTFQVNGTVLATNGNLTASLNPVEAITAGAHWRVDGGAWRTNGETASNLTAGSHTVEYQPVSWWYAPVSQIVQIAAGYTNAISGYYSQVPPPTIGNLQRLPSGSISLDATGATGYSIVLQRSLDLQTWSNLQTNAVASGTFYDFDAPNRSNAFYRVTLQ